MSIRRWHPFVSMTFFAVVIIITFSNKNPIIVGLSFVMAIMLAFLIEPAKNVLKSIGWYVLLISMVALSNPLFSHRGQSILFFINDNPITLEAFLYGGMMGMMIAATLAWSRCFSLCIQSDQFLYLWGKPFPTMALVLMMAFRFIPLFKTQMKQVVEAQKAMGLYKDVNFFSRLAKMGGTFVSVIGWAGEHAMSTAESMNARGYGIKKRTNYSQYHMTARMIGLLSFIVIMTMMIILAFANGGAGYGFYPLLYIEQTKSSFITIGAIGVFMVSPCILEIGERWRWMYLRSRI